MPPPPPGTITDPIIRSMPATMRNQGWTVGARMMETWLSGPPNDNPYNSYASSIITMDWALQFQRARAVYDEIVSANYVKKYLYQIAPHVLPGQSFGIAYSEARNVEQEKDRTPQLVYTYSVGAVTDPLDDMYAALGRFLFRGFIRRGVCTQYTMECSEMGVYVWDRFDFNDDPGAWFSQPLGFWSQTSGGFNPFSGYYITNADFRGYRQRRGKGNDFIAYSDIRFVRFDPAISLSYPRRQAGQQYTE